MIKRFKYGFKKGRFTFGWLDKELYRLPTESYPLKKMKLIYIGNKKGYLVGNKRKTIDQLSEITTNIDYVYSKIKDKDVPF